MTAKQKDVEKISGIRYVLNTNNMMRPKSKNKI